MPTVACAAVEGLVDEAVARRLVEHVGIEIGPVYGKCGKRFVLDRVSAWNEGARYSPWLVIVDLDLDFECAAAAKLIWLPAPARYMAFRIATRSIEAWILADAERFARFFGVARARLPRAPEVVERPKRLIVDLCQTSRNGEVRNAIVPRPSAGREVGTGYTSMLLEFIGDEAGGWRPAVAAQNAPGLARAIRRLGAIATAAAKAD